MASFSLYALVSRNEVRQQRFSPSSPIWLNLRFSDGIQRLKYEHVRPRESKKPVNKLSLVILICSVFRQKEKE